MCYGGIFNSGFGRSLKTGRNGMASNVAGYLSSIHRLPEISDRLMRVQIENLDFRRIVNEYDGPGTFFYLDPPYVLSTRKLKAYKHELIDADHEALVKLLLEIKGKAMLSGYENPLYQPLESAGWIKHQFKVICRVNNNLRKNPEDGFDQRERTESIWLNFDVNGGIDQNRFGL
jgi:DNA adenine methylase